MKRHILIAALIATTLACFAYYAATSSVGSSVTHNTNAMCFTLSLIGLAVAAAISSVVFWRLNLNCRYYSILVFSLSCTVLAASTWYRTRQSSNVVGSLEIAYDTIANNGAPFPSETEVQQQYLSDLPEAYSVGYSVSPDRQSFEIYYHDSSDSYTMMFPDRNWDWRGYDYSGAEIAR